MSPGATRMLQYAMLCLWAAPAPAAQHAAAYRANVHANDRQEKFARTNTEVFRTTIYSHGTVFGMVLASSSPILDNPKAVRIEVSRCMCHTCRAGADRTSGIS